MEEIKGLFFSKHTVVFSLIGSVYCVQANCGDGIYSAANCVHCWNYLS